MSASDGHELLNKLASELVTDKPTVEAAVKNLVSLLMSKGAASTTSSEEQNISAKSLLALARYFLRGFRAVNHPELTKFESVRPTVEGQNANDRLDEILRYKAVLGVWKTVTENEQKTSSVLGRRYFQWSHSISAVRSSVVEEWKKDFDKSPASTATEEELTHFLDLFERSLSSSLTDDTDEALVWATDLNSVLRARQERRKAEVESRLAQPAETLSEVVEAAFADGESRIEKLPNDDEDDLTPSQ